MYSSKYLILLTSFYPLCYRRKFGLKNKFDNSNKALSLMLANWPIRRNPIKMLVYEQMLKIS